MCLGKAIFCQPTGTVKHQDSIDVVKESSLVDSQDPLVPQCSFSRRLTRTGIGTTPDQEEANGEEYKPKRGHRNSYRNSPVFLQILACKTVYAFHRGSR